MRRFCLLLHSIPIPAPQPRILKAQSPIPTPLIPIRTDGLRPITTLGAATGEVGGEQGAGDGSHFPLFIATPQIASRQSTSTASPKMVIIALSLLRLCLALAD